MTKINFPCVASIAGTDPSGGAGIQADIKAISATGCYAASIITALVAQNTQGVQAIQEVSPEFIRQQIQSVFSDLNISAVKIGMLHRREIIEVIADEMKNIKPKHVVLDPVMIAKNGSVLLDMCTLGFLKQRLFPFVTLLTPNLFEAEKLTGIKITNRIEMESAAYILANESNISVLVKGGHLDSAKSADVLYSIHNSALYWFESERIDTQNTHGTGCTLSSAIASYLAQGYSLQAAIRTAKNYLTDGILSGSKFQIGQGRGPVDHFHFLENRKQYV